MTHTLTSQTEYGSFTFTASERMTAQLENFSTEDRSIVLNHLRQRFESEVRSIDIQFTSEYITDVLDPVGALQREAESAGLYDYVLGSKITGPRCEDT